MRLNKYIISLAFFLMLAGSLRSNELVIIPKPFQIPEFGTVKGYLVTLGKHKFSFIPPPRWHVETDSKSQKVTCLASNLGASLSFKLLSPNPVPLEEGELTDQALQIYIKMQYPDADIIRKFPSYTNGTQGQSFDLKMLAQGKYPVTYRLAYIPVGKDLIEFNLTSSSTQFEKYHNAYGYFMSSFKLEASSDPNVKGL